MGDGMQRLAHYFANELEARLNGSRSQICKAFNALAQKFETIQVEDLKIRSEEASSVCLESTTSGQAVGTSGGGILTEEGAPKPQMQICVEPTENGPDTASKIGPKGQGRDDMTLAGCINRRLPKRGSNPPSMKIKVVATPARKCSVWI
ncbi:hypothetical protein AAG906_003882 [Vitis piasezkii]